MFSLFSGVYHWLFSRPEVCLLLVGLQGSGKTTFFEQLKQRYATSGPKAAPGIAAVERQQQARASVDNSDKGQRHEQPTHGRRRDTVRWRIIDQQDTFVHGGQQEESHQNHVGPSLPLRQRQTADDVGALASLRAASTRQSLCSLPRVSSTTGLNYCRFRYQDVDVVLWDLAGLASFHAMWEEYFRNAHCVLYFVDSTSSAESMRESRAALDSLLSAAATVVREDTGGKKHVCPPPVLVVAAKQDLTRAPLESAGELRAFSSGKANSAASSARQQQTQQQSYKHEHPLSGSPDHGCLSEAVFPHSACSWDSVEELFRRAVRSAKAYHELLSLPMPEVGPASLEKPSAPKGVQETCYKPGAPGCPADSRELRTSLPGIAAAPKGQALEGDLGLQLVHAGSKYGKTEYLPQNVSHRRHTCSAGPSAVCQSEPAEGDAQVFLNSVEVPCCHYATTSPSSGASSIAGATFVCAPLSGGCCTDATHRKTGRLTKAAVTATGGGRAAHIRAYGGSGSTAPFRVVAARGEDHTRGEGGECSAPKTNMSRVSSGLYELDDSV